MYISLALYCLNDKQCLGITSTRETKVQFDRTLLTHLFQYNLDYTPLAHSSPNHKVLQSFLWCPENNFCPPAFFLCNHPYVRAVLGKTRIKICWFFNVWVERRISVNVDKELRKSIEQLKRTKLNYPNVNKHITLGNDGQRREQWKTIGQSAYGIGVSYFGLCCIVASFEREL